MKCRSIVAIAVAIVVSSFGAVGFAADVNTTTTYNTNSNKIEVGTSVTGATSDSEVTYIVKSDGKVVYIVQDTAEDGKVNFTYKIDKDKIASDYITSVKFGSSAEDEKFDGIGTDSLGIKTLQQAEDDKNYTIVYPGNEIAWGFGETVTASVVPKSGYEVVSISVNGEIQETINNTLDIKYGDEITAEVKEIVVEPALTYIDLGLEDETGANEGLKSRIAILKPQGEVKEIGVVYNGEFYKSSVNVMSAVKIIFPKDEVKCEFHGAYKIDGNDEIIYGTEEIISDSEQ